MMLQDSYQQLNLLFSLSVGILLILIGCFRESYYLGRVWTGCRIIAKLGYYSGKTSKWGSQRTQSSSNFALY